MAYFSNANFYTPKVCSLISMKNINKKMDNFFADSLCTNQNISCNVIYVIKLKINNLEFVVIHIYV